MIFTALATGRDKRNRPTREPDGNRRFSFTHRLLERVVRVTERPFYEGKTGLRRCVEGNAVSIPVARYWSGAINSRFRQVRPKPE
jgi:hypothetical protein